jgi:hypothetical protein
MTSPASTEAMPPENCCTEELTALNDPRFVISGMADINACDGIMRENIPTNINTVTTMTVTSDTRPRCV